MQISIEKLDNQVAVVVPEGRLDLASAPQFKQELSETVADGFWMIVVDLSNVPFVDSSGLGALISGMKTTRLAGGNLRIAYVGTQARMIFELTNLNKVMKLYDTVEEALIEY